MIEGLHEKLIDDDVVEKMSYAQVCSLSVEAHRQHHKLLIELERLKDKERILRLNKEYLKGEAQHKDWERQRSGLKSEYPM